MSSITLPVRKVYKNPVHKYYTVVEMRKGMFHPVSKNYDHSTSAFAALGRLVQKDVLARLSK